MELKESSKEFLEDHSNRITLKEPYKKLDFKTVLKGITKRSK